ncbi:DUF6146 family protein [Psychroserpens damuponensis]|uniref:DUF6146 family protein n=1 Tax=Psychroserpens damuponensis TaxID=943936 RepID=UPI000591536A|nr:DUF6146 family protein [Psychroserpens damuponensis]
MTRITQLFIITLLLVSCGSYQTTPETNLTNVPEEDIVRIANDDIEYEIIIIEPGFNTWLASMARPEGYYSQSYMEARNNVNVKEWNNRVLQPHQYDSNLYELRIDYNPSIDYGYDVNYKLFNYFTYFQITYKQRLSSFVPRI